MPRHTPADLDRIANAVRDAGRSRLDHRERTAGVDLSADAIAARREAGGAGLTGRELAGRARDTFNRAKQLRTVANRRMGKRAVRAAEQADKALLTAAAQIRLAQLTPLDRGYLHALSLDKIQTVQAEVSRAFDQDAGALAVDTHRRIEDQKMRVRAEAGRL